jgi:HTH-type transcriptional regulator/antitoxin MqsA
MTMLTVCPVCGEGHLTPQVGRLDITINGRDYELPSYYAICNSCESEVADADDVNENARVMRELRDSIGASFEDVIRSMKENE